MSIGTFLSLIVEAESVGYTFVRHSEERRVGMPKRAYVGR